MSGRELPEPERGRPCERVLPRLLFEVARVRARYERLNLAPCIRCGASNGIVLGRGTNPSLCYRDRVRETEEHHPRTGRSGPVAPGTDANEHRVVSEAERIWRRIAERDMCEPCVIGLNRLLAVRLTSLGSLGHVG